MRAGTALAALLGVASFGVAAWGQAPVTNVAGTSTVFQDAGCCLLYTSPSPRDLSTSRMPSSA